MHFLAIGDWGKKQSERVSEWKWVINNGVWWSGGQDTEPYSQPAQVAAAAGMATVAKEHNSQFVLAL
jgi:hypothetical protein